MDLSKEKSDKLKEMAEKKWEEDAEKAGLAGMSISEAVHAAMFHPATAALPDPLVEEEPDDKDNWLLQAHRAGLMLDDDIEIVGMEEGDGTGLAQVKAEPGEPGEPGEAELGEPGEPEPQGKPSPSTPKSEPGRKKRRRSVQAVSLSIFFRWTWTAK